MFANPEGTQARKETIVRKASVLDRRCSVVATRRSPANKEIGKSIHPYHKNWGPTETLPCGQAGTILCGMTGLNGPQWESSINGQWERRVREMSSPTVSTQMTMRAGTMVCKGSGH